MTTIISQPFAGSNYFRLLTENIPEKNRASSPSGATNGVDPLTALLASSADNETGDLTYDMRGRIDGRPEKGADDVDKAKNSSGPEMAIDWAAEVIRTTSLNVSAASSTRDLLGEELRFGRAMHTLGVRPEDIVRNFVPEGMTKESVYDLTPEAYQAELSKAYNNASQREQKESWAYFGVDFDAYIAAVDNQAYAAMGVPGSIQTLQNAIDFYNSTHKVETSSIDPETLTEKQKALLKMLEDTNNYWKKRAKDQLDQTISSLFNSYGRTGNLIETDTTGRVSVGTFELSYKGVQIYRPNRS
ncbi:hypothetical protein EXN24_02555 [Rhizobium rhizogenes]|nr:MULTISPECIES: hypothetical protein [Rhizobium/Agrobacterium group]AKC07718.1 hypothetical protein Ach5_19420 [Agrobacterium tumefaciens]AYM16558.1 hypothetical protein At15955_15720 [Agrobacterium tumefaciens]AYM67859.1 hypothetical protein AtA6_16420 [Agrobacterium tumefaciens]MDX8325010.1 hypothetical protein [Agrobacterium tumefaciens]NIB55446.1 hypothetical protein [Agrobacterium tumefaciens]